MKFSILKTDLESGLKVASATVCSSGSDITTHYLFRPDAKFPDYIEILSQNARVFSVSPVKVKFDGEERSVFTIEAKRLGQLLSAVKSDTLEFDVNAEGEVKVTVARGSNLFSSLDPNNFRWEELASQGTVTAKVPARRLHDALTVAKQFVSDQEARAPHLCVAEFRNGCLYSTDQAAVSVVRVPGMENSKLRLHNKDISPIISFLATFKDKEEVEVIECERAVVFRREDQALTGSMLFQSKFPDLAVDWNIEDDHWWDVSKSDVKEGVDFLVAGAKQDDNRLVLEAISDTEVKLRMKSVAGKDIYVSAKLTGRGDKTGITNTLPEGGFPLAHTYLINVLSYYKDDKVRVGITAKNKGGWVRLKDTRDGNDYLIILAWLVAKA